MAFDTEFIRSNFPAFSDPNLSDLAFFESAGGSYACQQVINRLERFYRQRKVQPNWAFEPSRDGGIEMQEARQRLSAMLGVSADELSFGPSTTQNAYALANAFGEYFTSGDAIVVTNQDHEANSGVWRRLSKLGIEVREWQIDPESGHLAIETLEPLLDGAKLLAFPHCSNVVGEINDAARIIAMAHSAGAVTCVDGVSYAPHGLPNVGELGADIYLFSAYKTYGPHQGIMVVRRELAARLPNQSHHFHAEILTSKFTPAGPDHAQIAACAGIADYVDEVFGQLDLPRGSSAERAAAVHDAMHAREQSLLQPLLDFLRSKKALKLIGPHVPSERAPTISLLSDRPGEELATALVPYGIAAGGGDFYSARPLLAMGIDPAHGVLRLSFTHYTSPAEIERLMSALDQIL